MKGIKVTLAVAASALLLSSPAMAFHSGGVAECEGCHTMHNSLEGKAVTKEDGTATGLKNQFQAGPFLLKANDQSSACLNCHESTPGSYHISTPGAPQTGSNITTSGISQYTPGGDFAWLKMTFTYTSYSGNETSAGERHGHNIVAADYNYAQDSTQTASPGGNYDPSKFFCSSCHDPHGRYRRSADNLSFATTGAPIYTSGSYGAAPKTVNGVTYAVGAYRILGGNSYLPKSLATAGRTDLAFTTNPPLAIAPSSFNATDTTLAGNVKVMYGEGMSEWCGNCHAKMVENGYTSGMAGLVHPAGNNAKMAGGSPNPIYQNYNQYVTSGVMTGGGYTNLVPFESGDVTTAGLKTANGTASATTNVLCLSCHRAHASGFNSMLRFDPSGSEFMTTLDSNNNVSYNGTDIAGTPSGAKNQGRSIADWTAAYNGRPSSVFGAYQRALCNKCHAKD